MSAVQTVSPAPRRRTLAERYPALRRFLRHRAALLGVGVVVFMTLFSLVGPWLMPFNATDTVSRARARTCSEPIRWAATSWRA